MNIRSSVSILPLIRSIEDPFSKEIIHLWDDRKMQGKLYWFQKGKLPLGYILMQEEGEINTIRGLYVVPEARGKGIATKLLRKVCDIEDAREVRVIVVNITEGAENVYIRNKFKLLGKRKDFPDQIIAYRGILTDSENQKIQKKLI